MPLEITIYGHANEEAFRRSSQMNALCTVRELAPSTFSDLDIRRWLMSIETNRTFIQKRFNNQRIIDVVDALVTALREIASDNTSHEKVLEHKANAKNSLVANIIAFATQREMEMRVHSTRSYTKEALKQWIKQSPGVIEQFKGGFLEAIVNNMFQTFNYILEGKTYNEVKNKLGGQPMFKYMFDRWSTGEQMLTEMTTGKWNMHWIPAYFLDSPGPVLKSDAINPFEAVDEVSPDAVGKSPLINLIRYIVNNNPTIEIPFIRPSAPSMQGADEGVTPLQLSKKLLLSLNTRQCVPPRRMLRIQSVNYVENVVEWTARYAPPIVLFEEIGVCDDVGLDMFTCEGNSIAQDPQKAERKMFGHHLRTLKCPKCMKCWNTILGTAHDSTFATIRQYNRRRRPEEVRLPNVQEEEYKCRAALLDALFTSPMHTKMGPAINIYADNIRRTQRDHRRAIAELRNQLSELDAQFKKNDVRIVALRRRIARGTKTLASIGKTIRNESVAIETLKSQAELRATDRVEVGLPYLPLFTVSNKVYNVGMLVLVLAMLCVIGSYAWRRQTVGPPNVDGAVAAASAAGAAAAEAMGQAGKGVADASAALGEAASDAAEAASDPAKLASSVAEGVGDGTEKLGKDLADGAALVHEGMKTATKEAQQGVADAMAQGQAVADSVAASAASAADQVASAGAAAGSQVSALVSSVGPDGTAGEPSVANA